MDHRLGLLARLIPALLSLAMFLGALPALGQDGKLPTAFAGGMSTFFVLFGVLGYIYIALALYTIAQKTNTANAWLAWIPLLNIILILSIAKKPIWWILLLFIPLVNIVIAVLVWMAVAEARNKPSWWGILMLVPGVNLIVPGYLAWSD